MNLNHSMFSHPFPVYLNLTARKIYRCTYLLKSQSPGLKLPPEWIQDATCIALNSAANGPLKIGRDKQGHVDPIEGHNVPNMGQ